MSPAGASDSGVSGAAAEQPPSSLSLIVTGDPVDGPALRCFVGDVIDESLLSSNAHGVSYNLDAARIPGRLGEKETAFIEVPAKISRPDGSVGKRPIYVITKNIGLEEDEDSCLIVSNDPEEIASEGSLVSKTLKAGKPARLLYYHSGAPGKDFFLRVLVSNPNDYPVDISFSKSFGGPSADGIFAGHVATRRFMRLSKLKISRIIKIPPFSEVELLRQEIKEKEVSTGIMRICELSGKGAVLRLIANADGKEFRAKLTKTETKEDGRMSGSIEKAFIDIKKNFSFGGEPLEIRIGEGPTFFSKVGGFDLHLGNYGIIHRIYLELVNKTGQDRAASVYYVASGGPARGVLNMNGTLFETKLLDPKDKKSEKIAVFHVKAGSSRSVSIKLMPQPGSFYPTRLVVMGEKP